MFKNTRLLFVIFVTVVSLYLVTPTLMYFVRVSTLPADAPQAQRDELKEMLHSENMIRLGLDLQGGVDFLMAVDTSRLVRRNLESDAEQMRGAFRRDSIDASVAVDPDNLRITVKLNDPKQRNLAASVVTNYSHHFTIGNLDALGSENAEDRRVVLTALPQKIEGESAEAFEGAMKVVQARVDNLGLTNPIVVRQGSDRIRVQIPGQADPQRIRDNLLRSAQLEFRMLHPEHDTAVAPFLKAPGILPDVGTGYIDDRFLEDITPPGAREKTFRLKKDIPGVPAGYTLRLGVQRRMDPQTGEVKQEWKNLAYLVEERVRLTGDQLARAAAYTDFNSLEDPVVVSLEFNREGTRIFADTTRDNVNKRFAVLLDDIVYTAPNIREPILGGRAQISGGFSQGEARDLSLVLKAGTLKAPLTIIEDNAIGPSLGAESIRDAGLAMLVGSIFLVAFMAVIYSTAGWIAVIAMFLNVLMVLASLALANATLTLSGVGGILLSMGMAVDGNVLIYERLREEVEDNGRPIRAAINAAFGRALTVILDSNITSLLPALVLILFEVVQGSVKGFWLTLSIGLIANLYTGIVVTRALVEVAYEMQKKVSAGSIRIFKNANFDWMGTRKVGLIFSGTLTIVTVIYLASGAVQNNLGIDFTGGVLAQVRAGQNAKVEDIRAALSNSHKDVQVVSILNSDKFQVIVPSREGGADALAKIRTDIEKDLKAKFGDATQILSTTSIDATVSREFLINALWMIAVTCLVVGGYLAFRFQPVFGIAAAIALVHDVLVTLGVFLLMGKIITMDIVSALLIILGYSVNDTIVVFDRIREELKERTGSDLHKVFNLAINRTLGRTIFTGVTVLITLFALLFFGGAALSDFSFTLIVGILFGTYSSIFVASAIAYVALKRRPQSLGTMGQRVVKTTTKPLSTLGATD